jgi:hypothetical protein
MDGKVYPHVGAAEGYSMVYFTDLLGVEKPFVETNATVIANSAIVDSTNAHLTLSDNAAGITAPKGFSTVTNFFSANGNTWTSKILSVQDFADTPLTAYSEVSFAIKVVNGHITQTAPEWKDIDSDATSPWISFHLIQESGGTWTIEILKDGVLWGTQTKQAGNTIGSIFNTSNDNGRIVVYQKTANNLSNADVNIYATEVRGVFQTGIDQNATQVWEHIWNPYYFEGGSGEQNGKWSTEAAPEGFTKVSEHTWTTGGDFSKTGRFNDSDISEYSDIWFAMKAENATIYVQGAPIYAGGGWVYVHYHQNDDGMWTKDYRSADGYFDNVKQTSGNITGTKLTEMITWKEGVNQGSYPNGATEGVEATAYFTEVVGVKKAVSDQR